MVDLLEYKCPCCGGSVEFNSTVQRMKCPYCDTEFDIDELKAAQETSHEAEDTDSGMKIYVCQSCGGELIGDGTVAASSCPYCDSPIVIKGQFSGELRPELVIPFKLDKKAAKEALKKHIGSKKFIPEIFKSENHIDEIKGIYVPEWIFGGTVQADVVYRAEKKRRWSDSNYDYVETAHYDLYRGGRFSFDGLPVDGSSKMDDALMESVEPFDVGEAVDFDTAYLAGYMADRYDVDAEQSRERVYERVKESAFELFKRSTAGYESVCANEKRSLVDADGVNCRYALYPVWLLNTSWNGQKYIFAMNGQTGKMVGDLPLDKKAFWKWMGILTAAIGSAVYAVIWLITLMM